MPPPRECPQFFMEQARERAASAPENAKALMSPAPFHLFGEARICVRSAFDCVAAKMTGAGIELAQGGAPANHINLEQLAPFLSLRL